MAGGQSYDPIGADASTNSIGAIGEQLARAASALPFPHITAAMVHAYNAEVLLHQVDSGPYGGEPVLATAQAYTQDAMRLLGALCASLANGKGQLNVYLTVCGVSAESLQDEDTLRYAKVLGALARMPEIRAATEKAQGLAADIGAWTQRAKTQYPHSIPPPEMLHELNSIAAYYGKPATEVSGPETSADDDAS